MTMTGTIILNRFVLKFLVLLAVVIGVPVHADEYRHFMRMPGKLVSVGTHKLHIYCTGHGSPAVIIDSGMGGFSLEWLNIQTRLSQYSQVCTYDRAGYGWSEPGPLPRTTQQITKELHSLLVNAEIPAPYILVGHSFGGYTMRYYASTFPKQVVGMILVDSSHPEQFARIPGLRVSTEPQPAKRWTITFSHPVIPDNYPERAKLSALLLMSTAKALYTRQQEMESFRLSAYEVAMANNMPDIPLTVISHGKHIWPKTDIGDRSEQAWSELQNELCKLTSYSDHEIAATSGHLIHLDQPNLVSNAVIKMVTLTDENIAMQSPGGFNQLTADNLMNHPDINAAVDHLISFNLPSPVIDTAQ